MIKKSRKLLLSFGVGALALSVPLLFVSASTDPIFEPFDEGAIDENKKWNRIKTNTYTFEKNVNDEQIVFDDDLSLDSNYYRDGFFETTIINKENYERKFGSYSHNFIKKATLNIKADLKTFEKIITTRHIKLNNGKKIYFNHEKLNKWREYLKQSKNKDKKRDVFFNIKLGWNLQKVKKTNFHPLLKENDNVATDYNFREFQENTFFDYWYKKGYIVDNFQFRQHLNSMLWDTNYDRYPWTDEEANNYFWNRANGKKFWKKEKINGKDGYYVAKYYHPYLTMQDFFCKELNNLFYFFHPDELEWMHPSYISGSYYATPAIHNLKNGAWVENTEKYRQKVWINFVEYKYDLYSLDLSTVSLDLEYDEWNGVEEIQRAFWNELQNDFNDNLLKNKKIYSLTDTGGDLYTPFNEKILNEHSNIYYLEQKLNEYFQKLYVSKKEKFNKLKGVSLENDWLETFKNLGFGYSVANSNTIDIFFLNRVLIRSVKVEFTPTDHYKNAKIFDRLKVEFGKWVDFQKGTTELVDDVPVRDENDKKPIGLKNGVYYDGRWIVHTPMKVSFDSFSENEVLIINGKRVDVLNGHFEKDLNDLRENANDNERVLNGNVVDENTEKNDENSHKKNEFKIQILKYKVGSKGNLDADLELTYEKTFIIDSKSSMEDFKWYAWDPDNNKHQRELIEEYMKNEKGELLKNEKGDYIKNPKYDPLIDAKTGTKKQLVLMDFSKIGLTFENNFNQDTVDYNYARNSKLPYKSKFIFPPHSNLSDFQKVIAEAVVIEKGGIKELIGNTQNFTLFKLNENNFTFEKVEGDKYFKELETNTGESSYFSNEGTWLFCSNAEGSISNFKLVMIRGDKSNNNYFTELQKYNKNEIVPLWKSDLGNKLRTFILKDGTIKKESIYKLSYEEVLEWYKKYINFVYKNTVFTHYINPVFKSIENDKYTYNQFLELYAIQGLKRANSGESLSDGDKQFNEGLINDSKNRKKFMKFKDDFLGDFEYKERVEIEYVEMSPNKDGVYVKLRLNTLDRSFAFDANSGYQLLKIKFSDINATADKKALELKVNTDWFINFAKTKNQSQFEREIWNHKKLWFSGISDKELEMLNLNVIFNASTGALTLNVSLKDTFENEYYLPYNSFEITIKEFNTDPAVNSGIFEGYNFNEFNLNGLDERKAIEAYIFKIIDENFKGLVRNKDFIIKNLDAVIDKMKMAQIGTNKKLMTFTNLTLEAIGDKVGFKNIRVYNYVRKYIANDINLNNLKIKDVEIEGNSYKDIMQKVIKHVNDALKEHNLIYGYEIDIQNLSDGINKLMLGNGADFVFKVVGIHKKVKGSISFKVVNKAKEVLDHNGNKYLYDLSSIKINDLFYKEYRMNVLKEKILADIFKVMKVKYQLEFKKHYDIDIDALNLLIMAITKKSEKEIVGVLKLKSINGVSKNETVIKMHNHNKDYDAINDLDSSIPDAESLKKKARRKKTIMLSTLIPLGLFGLIGLGTLAWFIYVRKYGKRVK